MIRRPHGLHYWLPVFAALAALAVARPALAQGNGRMEGFVTDPKGQPVEGAKVSIEAADGSRKYETKTSKNGDYTQVGLPSGSYKVTVTKDNMGGASVVTVRQGPPIKTNFKLAIAGGGGNPELTKAFNEGLEAEKAGNHDDAIAKFTHAAEISPTCAECYFSIGSSEAAKKDYDKAEAAFKKTIELKADHADAYNGLANIYNAQRKFDLAAEASAKATELANTAGGAAGGGGNPEAMFNQGVILWNAGKIPEAKKQFQAVIALKPDHAESHYQLAMALVNEGNLKDAGTEFDTYLKLAPNGPNAATAKALAAQLPK